MERYELVEGTSAKFWEAGVTETTLTVRYGRIGTQGRSKDTTFSDTAAATKEMDRLVREKTGKGYARTSEAPAMAAAPAETVAWTTKSAARSEPEAAIAAIEAPTPVPTLVRTIFDGTPLPTRLRPGRHLGSDEARHAVRAPLTALLGEADGARLISAMPAPDGLGDWIGSILDALTEARDASRPHPPGDDDLRRFLEATLRYGVENGGTMAVARLADRMRPDAGKRRAPRNLAWAEPLQLALRAALVHAPKAEYDAAVAYLNDRIAAVPDWPTTAAFAFILADDRPAPHALQPLAALDAAHAAGIAIVIEPSFLPLVVDADPAAAAPWRIKRYHYLTLPTCALDASETAATLIAVAQAAGQPALPGLDWLMHYARGAERGVVARAMLATGEADALSVLLPHLREKPIAAALDSALDVAPEMIVPRCLAALPGGRAEAALRARVVRALDTHGLDTVRGWLEAADGRPARVLDALVQARAVPLAERAAWPRVLRDPPWRAKNRGADTIVLALDPLPTPLVFEAVAVPEAEQGDRHPHILGGMGDLVRVIDEAETEVTESDRSRAPPVLSPPPRDDPDALLAWLCQRLRQIDETHECWLPWPYHSLVRRAETQPDSLALALWSLTGVLASGIYIALDPALVTTMLSRFGEAAVPGLVALVEANPIALLPVVLTVDAGGIAPQAARALSRLKTARAPALAWLRRHRHTAITRLVPDAVGRPGAARAAAEHVLRGFASDAADGFAAIAAVVAAYAAHEPRVAAAMAQVLDGDPLAHVPAKVGKPPAWIVPGALAKPCLVAGGALPDEAVLILCEMLSFTRPEAVYAGVGMVRDACTPDSLAAFAWDLFAAWTAAGTPARDGWALRTLGWFGDDATARDLTRLIRRWPGEAAHARAVTGLDVLADIGTDVALLNLNGIAEKLTFKGLQDRAREKIAQVAAARGLSAEELSDRLAPDLDLDERGGLDLDFGPRRFRVGFDETLKPWVRDEAGGRFKNLPKPIRADDPEKAAAASARWSALKKDARAMASLQVSRLEAMLVGSRRVRPEVFGPFFATHPLVRHLTQRLVWATFTDADPRTPPTTTFRVAEDLGFTDSTDEAVVIDLSAGAGGFVGLVHPLHLGTEALTAWGTLFGDYEIAQPFPQLGREIFTLTDTETAAARSRRFAGVVVESKRLRGMPARGWRLGDTLDGGGIRWIERTFPFANGATGKATLTFADGLVAGVSEFEGATQTLGDLVLESSRETLAQEAPRTSFGDLDPVTASELLRGPSLLAGTRLR